MHDQFKHRHIDKAPEQFLLRYKSSSSVLQGPLSEQSLPLVDQILKYCTVLTVRESVLCVHRPLWKACRALPVHNSSRLPRSPTDHRPKAQRRMPTRQFLFCRDPRRPKEGPACRKFRVHFPKSKSNHLVARTCCSTAQCRYFPSGYR